ncbi:Proton-coupled amino acid transporter 2 [Intoshia linei]|uniref:Proton-coupled amino acid transporter 2 n=1 Tax=Intoshia linei TaxID=1819745 RepID=A0A177AY64_9BILA|nr:Proton-coupled amino acid transporter 2 [Intoshia linei]
METESNEKSICSSYSLGCYQHPSKITDISMPNDTYSINTEYSDIEIHHEIHYKDENEASLFCQIGDFANMVKAFIGTNYMALPFAFAKSGLVAGILGLTLIAFLTNHCSQVLINCKTKYIESIICHEEKKVHELKETDRKILKSELEKNITYSDLGRLIIGPWAAHLIRISIIISQYLTVVGYFIFIIHSISNLLPNYFPNDKNNTTITFGITLSTIYTSQNSMHLNNFIDWPSHLKYAIVVMIPLPFFYFCGFFRTVRKLSIISCFATIFLLFGIVAVLRYLYKDYSVTKDFNYFEFNTLPIFFGQLTSSFEGIGCILPIHASMNNNRKSFSWLLSLAIFFVYCILLLFGVSGYLRYGTTVDQIIIDSVEMGNVSIYIVIITLMISVILTYPLQVFPCIEMIEIYIFTWLSGVCDDMSLLCYKSNKTIQVPDYNHINNAPPDEYTNLIRDFRKAENTIEPTKILKTLGIINRTVQIPFYKRMILQIVIITSTAVVSIFIVNYFAYLGALTGALGASVLSFIIPCLIELSLRFNDINCCIVLKNVTIIIFSIVESLIILVIFAEMSYSV